MPTEVFPDVEVELVAWLKAQLGVGVRVCTELPDDLDAELPAVKLQRTTGPDDPDGKLDQPLVDVDVYAATRGAASLLANQIRQLVRYQLRNTVTAAVVFGAAETLAGPHWLPDDNTNLRRYNATYLIPFHTVPTP